MRVTYILAVAAHTFRCFPAQRIITCKIYFLILLSLWRPLCIGLPFIGTAHKYGRLGYFRGITLPFQVVVKERHFYILLVPGRCIAAKLYVAQVGTIVIGPLLMIPRSHHYFIKVFAGIIFFGGEIAVPCAPVIFGIKCAAHPKHGGLQVLRCIARITGFPEVVIVGVVHQVFPEPYTITGKFCQCCQRQVFQVKFITVVYRVAY